jgi:hypothetical protein
MRHRRRPTVRSIVLAVSAAGIAIIGAATSVLAASGGGVFP